MRPQALAGNPARTGVGRVREAPSRLMKSVTCERERSPSMTG